MTPFEIISVVLALSTIAFGVIGWFLNNIINQHRELNKAKAETTDSKFDGLIQRLDDLVTQIGHLFQDQEVVVESIDGLVSRVSALEQKCEGATSKCTEREKAVEDKFKVLHNRVDDVRSDLKEGGRRTYDPPSQTNRNERTD